jgi:hypothetical protein
MKKFFKEATIFTMGCVVAMSMVACHSGEDEPGTQEYVVPSAVKNSLRIIVVDQDGIALTGAVVKVNNKNYNTNSQNVIEFGGLKDGSYVVEVSKNEYSTESMTVQLKSTTKEVDGSAALVGENKEITVYLIKEVESEPITLGASGDSKTLSIETSRQNDGTGRIVGNTQDPSNTQLNSEVTVKVETPALNNDEIKAVESQLAGTGVSVSTYTITLKNLTTIEDKNTRAITVVGETFNEDQYSFFAGVQVGAPARVDFTLISPLLVAPVEITVPDANVKNAVKLYRRVGNGSWKEVTATSQGNGIARVDFTSSANSFIVYLNILESQDFALGMLIDEVPGKTEISPLFAGPLVNNQSTTQSITSMPYTVQSGVVIENVESTFLVDYLRKVVLRHYAMRAVYEAQTVERTYEFTPAYSLPSQGQLFLTGYQTITSSVFSVVNGSASFQAVVYGDAVLYPYHVAPAVPTTHVGGGND